MKSDYLKLYLKTQSAHGHILAYTYECIALHALQILDTHEHIKLRSMEASASILAAIVYKFCAIKLKIYIVHLIFDLFNVLRKKQAKILFP